MDIFTDTDLEKFSIRHLKRSIAECVVADFQGRSTAPPRHAVDFPNGKLVFTTGGYGNLAGFRVYETFRAAHRNGTDQAVLAWNTDTGRLEGAYFGTRLGALRTGILGGLAVAVLTPATSESCAVIGTGTQAETQLLGILACRELRGIRVYSRHADHRERFAECLAATADIEIELCDDPEEALSGCEIVVLATNATEPVVEADWLRSARHITTVGPKFRDAHELPLAAVESRRLVSDSPQQIREHGERHMLYGHPRWNEIRHLGEALSAPNPAETSPSLYLSAGLAGTEVAALHAVGRYLRGDSGT